MTTIIKSTTFDRSIRAGDKIIGEINGKQIIGSVVRRFRKGVNYECFCAVEYIEAGRILRHVFREEELRKYTLADKIAARGIPLPSTAHINNPVPAVNSTPAQAAEINQDPQPDDITPDIHPDADNDQTTEYPTAENIIDNNISSGSNESVTDETTSERKTRRKRISRKRESAQSGIR